MGREIQPLRTAAARAPRRWWSIVVATLLAGCSAGDETGMPQPFPLPKPRVQLMRAGGALPDTVAEITIVGFPGAVARAGTVSVERAGVATQAQSTAAGSFILERVSARAAEVLLIRLETSEAAELAVPVLGVMVPRPPGPIAGVPPVTAPQDGKVTVIGRGAAGVAHFVVNVDSGDVALGRAAADERFEIAVAAGSGDALQVYEDRDPLLLAPWELVVP